jgi:hypothetical protein
MSAKLNESEPGSQEAKRLAKRVRKDLGPENYHRHAPHLHGFQPEHLHQFHLKGQTVPLEILHVQHVPTMCMPCVPCVEDPALLNMWTQHHLVQVFGGPTHLVFQHGNNEHTR